MLVFRSSDHAPFNKGGNRKPMALDRKTQIILALIPAVAGLLVAYWQFVYKRGHGDNETISYVVRVSDVDSRQAIAGAKVTIEASGIPPTPYTDSNGISPFALDKSIETIHLIVEAKGCEPFDRYQPLPQDGKTVDVRLKCSEPKSGPANLGLTYDNNPTVDQVRSDIEKVRHVTITYSSERCRQLVGKAVVRLNGAQLNGTDARDLLENGAKPRTDRQFSVVTRQEGSSYQITCAK
jgi:hypothetical protein